MRTYLRNFCCVSVIVAVALMAGCITPSIAGTYSDPNGAFVLTLKSGGDATFTFAGQPAMCTYKVNGNMLSLTCKGETEALVFTIQSDGSLTGPPGTLMPPLRKK